MDKNATKTAGMDLGDKYSVILRAFRGGRGPRRDTNPDDEARDANLF